MPCCPIFRQKQFSQSWAEGQGASGADSSVFLQLPSLARHLRFALRFMASPRFSLSHPLHITRRGVAMLTASLALLLGFKAEAARPANDNMDSATILNGTTGTLPGSTQSASVEAGEPLHAGRASGGTVWYRWPVFTKGKFNVQATSAAFVPVVAVYKQTDQKLAFTTITPIANSAVGNVTYDVEPGAVYMIAVASGVRASGAFTLNWKFTLSPGGGPDLVIVPESVKANVITRGFGPLDCDVQDGCIAAGTNRILAISYDVANRGKEDVYLGDPTRSPWAIRLKCRIDAYFWGMHRYILRDGKNVIVKMAEPVEHCFRDDIKDAANAGPQRFFCLFQGLQVGWAQSTIPELECHFLDVSDIPPGAYTLEILVDPWNRIAELNEANNSVKVPVVIDAECSGPPPNDNRENAFKLEGSVAAAIAHSECATKEPGEKSHYSGIPAGRSVWFQWTAPYSGPVTLSTEGSGFDTDLEVQGAAVNGVNGLTVASNDDASPGIAQSRLKFDAVEGSNYWFVVDGFNFGAGSQGGRVILSLNPGANDSFANPQILTGVSGTATGNNGTAQLELGEPQLAGNPGGHSVWFRWTAPANGPVQWDTKSSGFPTVLGAFTGSQLNALTPAQTNLLSTPDGGVSLGFNAVAETTYWLALDGKNGASGLYQLHWLLIPEVVVVDLRLLAERDNDGTVKLRLTGNAGKTVQVLRSTDLTTWTQVTSLSMTADGVSYADPDSATLPQAFYRAVQVP